MESCLAHRSDLALMRKLIFLLTIFLFTATPTPAGAADAIKGLLELPENLQEGPPTLQLKHFSLPVPTGRTKKKLARHQKPPTGIGNPCFGRPR